jgi:hypothetical protein
VSAISYSLNGASILEFAADGPVVRTVQDGVDVIGQARSQSADLVILPISRLDPAFFQLRTGLAGEILQKFVIYQVRVVILGDYSELAAGSTALRDFIRESNRGNAVWFLASVDEVNERIATEG